MAKIKYYYDTETCRYERVKTSKVDVFLNALGIISVCVFFGFLISILRSEYFPSFKEQQLKDANEELLLSYELLNKDISDLKTWLSQLQEKDDDIYRTIFEVPAIPEEVRVAGTGGSQKYQDLLDKNLMYEDLVLDINKKVDQLKKQMYIQTKSYDELIELAANKRKMLASIPAIRPVHDEDLRRFASGFGRRIDPILKIPKMHYGVDFSAPRGTPIYATGDGKVIKVEKNNRGYGNQIELDHGFGYVTKYAHLSAFNVKKGQLVKRGQKIGEVGNTGKSVAPHLHYEVRKKGRPINPINFFTNDLSPEQYDELLKKASVQNQSLGYY